MPATGEVVRRTPEHENLVEGNRFVSRLVPGTVAEDHGGAFLYRSGLPTATFNVAFLLDPPFPLAELRESIERILVRGGSPWRVVTAHPRSEELAPFLTELGVARAGGMPGMVWEPLPATPPPAPTELEIRRVRTSEEVGPFLAAGSEAFGNPPGSLDAWTARMRLDLAGPRPPIGLYWGWVDGRPVATALRFTSGTTAGIYFVATLPAFRRRGYGAAVTAMAALDGRSDGCVRSCLQATEMGRPVYERLGYRVTEEFDVWTPPGTDIGD